MTVLESLARHHGRLSNAGKCPVYGYSTERISFVIVLSSRGEAVCTNSLLDVSGKKPRPSLREVPRAVKRTYGFSSNFLWDRTAYALGVRYDGESEGWRASEPEHDAFKMLHWKILEDSDDEALKALVLFLHKWRCERYCDLPHAKDMLDTNVVFRLDGETGLIHERPAARFLWENHLEQCQGEVGLCLATGRRSAIARLHPAIKGVAGANSSGASIVSFNRNAFESFGKKQGANAPVSEATAFAYSTALNSLLLGDSRCRIRIGNVTAVFWAEGKLDDTAVNAAEHLFAASVEPLNDAEEEARIADILKAIADGRPLAEADPELREEMRLFVLGLSANLARVFVRFWHVDSIGAMARRIAEHWRDIQLEPTAWTTPPSVSRLLVETAVHGKFENIQPNVASATMHAILTGGRYPRSLLAAVVMRIRMEKRINGLRAAICKACLARDHRLGFVEEGVPVGLDPDETSTAYRLGRLFAMYERVQREALGVVNASIRDRYFGAASAAPASVFPLLERNSMHHLTTIRKQGKVGLSWWFENEIDGIVAGIDTAFPRSFGLEDQGRFAIGYHHQRATRHKATGSKSETSPSEPNAAEAASHGVI